MAGGFLTRDARHWKALDEFWQRFVAKSLVRLARKDHSSRYAMLSPTRCWVWKVLTFLVLVILLLPFAAATGPILALWQCALGAALALGPASSAAGPAAQKRNVVVFLADDAGWGDYGIHGNTSARTPRIDSIGREGARFDRFFVSAVCSPTRAEFLTGRYHPRGGVRGVSTGQERLDLDETTVADAFKAAGYATGAFGKWHNGSQWPYHPMARGFDEYYGHTSGHWGEYFDPPLEHNGKMVRDRGYIVDLCTNRALDFIGRNRTRPFLCYIPFTTPHSPWAVPEDYWRRFKDKPIGQRATNPEQEVIEETRCVLAMLENQDWNVGRVLRKLDERSEEHTSELQSPYDLVCRLLLE